MRIKLIVSRVVCTTTSSTAVYTIVVASTKEDFPLERGKCSSKKILKFMSGSMNMSMN
jgi:hypothetical protein